MKKPAIFSCVFVAILFIVWLALGSTTSCGNGNHRWQTEITALEVALERYKEDFGAYPLGNSASIAQALLGNNEKGTVYIEWRSMPKEGFVLDPWGRPYLFSYIPEKAPLIRSLGEDGILSLDDKTNQNEIR